MTNPIGIISMQFQRPFTAAHFPQFVQWRAAGFDFVELLVPEPGELDLAATGRRVERRGPRRCAGRARQPDRDLSRTMKQAQGRAGYLRYCVGSRTHWAQASSAGRFMARLWCSRRARRTRSTKRCASAAKPGASKGCAMLAPIAAAAGVKLGIEPLNRFETDILNTTRQGVALMGLVDHDAVGLVLDTFHMNMEDDDIAGAIRAAGRRLIHFQANENHRGLSAPATSTGPPSFVR